MKKVLLAILREFSIALVILIVLCAAIVLAFKDQLPFYDVIRKGDEYAKANMREYSISSSDRTSGIKAITITHETNSNQVIKAEDEVRIQTGKYTPFGSISGTTDLPSERVGYSYVIDEGESGDSEKLEYPDVEDEDLVSQIEREQSESSESAATRRFNNENF